MENKDLNQLSNKELLKEFFEALTDLEKRLVSTFRLLFLAPDKVIYGYIGGEKEKYFSVFRYFLLALFASYFGYNFFYGSSDLDSEYYHTLKKSVEDSMNMYAGTKGKYVTFEEESYKLFYLEYDKWMKYLFKFWSCIGIPVIFFSSLLFLRKRKINFAGHLVIATFLASQITIISFAMLLFEYPFSKNVIKLSYINLFPITLYMFFFFYKLKKPKSVKEKFKTGGATLGCMTVIMFFQALFGSLLTLYIRTYQPADLIIKDLNTGEIEIKTHKLGKEVNSQDSE